MCILIDMCKIASCTTLDLQSGSHVVPDCAKWNHEVGWALRGILQMKYRPAISHCSPMFSSRDVAKLALAAFVAMLHMPMIPPVLCACVATCLDHCIDAATLWQNYIQLLI